MYPPALLGVNLNSFSANADNPKNANKNAINKLDKNIQDLLKDKENLDKQKSYIEQMSEKTVAANEVFIKNFERDMGVFYNKLISISNYPIGTSIK